jgi:hypothetical protein
MNNDTFDPKALEIFNLAQEIVSWTNEQNWNDDWVIGGIASREGYDRMLKENILLKEKINSLKKFVQKL